jgi:hypothetical protein
VERHTLKDGIQIRVAIYFEYANKSGRQKVPILVQYLDYRGLSRYWTLTGVKGVGACEGLREETREGALRESARGEREEARRLRQRERGVGRGNEGVESVGAREGG